MTSFRSFAFVSLLGTIAICAAFYFSTYSLTWTLLLATVEFMFYFAALVLVHRRIHQGGTALRARMPRDS